ncbi:hypothetical protein ACFLY6_00815 [Candidatus Dependentiae bacterium]
MNIKTTLLLFLVGLSSCNMYSTSETCISITNEELTEIVCSAIKEICRYTETRREKLSSKYLFDANYQQNRIKLLHNLQNMDNPDWHLLKRNKRCPEDYIEQIQILSKFYLLLKRETWTITKPFFFWRGGALYLFYNQSLEDELIGTTSLIKTLLQQKMFLYTSENPEAFYADNDKVIDRLINQLRDSISPLLGWIENEINNRIMPNKTKYGKKNQFVGLYEDIKKALKMGHELSLKFPFTNNLKYPPEPVISSSSTTESHPIT